uniref:Uncharacterized protein n=1 Tax=Picea sitchensis TaxID=3332 RepID=D5AD39_PICSI|nr:unknown [Picea sitchensis]
MKVLDLTISDHKQIFQLHDPLTVHGFCCHGYLAPLYHNLDFIWFLLVLHRNVMKTG